MTSTTRARATTSTSVRLSTTTTASPTTTTAGPVPDDVVFDGAYQAHMTFTTNLQSFYHDVYAKWSFLRACSQPTCELRMTREKGSYSQKAPDNTSDVWNVANPVVRTDGVFRYSEVDLTDCAPPGRPVLHDAYRQETTFDIIPTRWRQEGDTSIVTDFTLTGSSRTTLNITDASCGQAQTTDGGVPSWTAVGDGHGTPH